MPEKPKLIDIPWVCSNCKALLGFISNSKEEVRIKYKDLYVVASGGTVSVICRKCGRLNVLTQEEDSDGFTV